MDNIREFLESRTDGRKHVLGFNPKLASLVPKGSDSFFLDEVVIYDLVCRSYRVAEGTSWRVEESYRDTFDIIEEAEDNSVQIYLKEGFGKAMKGNFVEGKSHTDIIPEEEVVDDVISYLDELSQGVRLGRYSPVERPDYRWEDIGREDRKIVSCAMDNDLTVVTYDQHFLPYVHMVDVSTPANTAEALGI